MDSPFKRKLDDIDPDNNNVGKTVETPFFYILVDAPENSPAIVHSISSSLQNALLSHWQLEHFTKTIPHCGCKIYRTTNVFKSAEIPILTNGKVFIPPADRKEVGVRNAPYFLIYDNNPPEENKAFDFDDPDPSIAPYIHTGIGNCLAIFNTRELAIAHHNCKSSKCQFGDSCSCILIRFALDWPLDVERKLKGPNDDAESFKSINSE